MPIQFQLVEPASWPPDDYDDAYYRRAEANARVHCLCGRFAKPGRKPQMDINGEYPFTVHCAHCGEVWIS